MWSSRLVALCAAFLASPSLLPPAWGSIYREHRVKNYTFPKDFIFGVATAAFQIEGAWNEGGKGESMWDTYTHNHPNYTLDGSNADIAADSYHKYKEDIEMVKQLGVKYYRMSISWPSPLVGSYDTLGKKWGGETVYSKSVTTRTLRANFRKWTDVKKSFRFRWSIHHGRLLPNGTDHHVSKDGYLYYRILFEELLRVNITPVVTLFHWDLPTPFMDLGGWSNPKTVDYFEDYARVVFNLYGDIIKIWTTLNEPHQHCNNGYGGDFFAPALRSSGFGEYLCAHYIMLGHGRVYRMYEKEFRPVQKGVVGLTLDSFWAEPKNKTNPHDHEASEWYLQMHLGMFAHPVYSEAGDYPDFVRNRINQMSFQQGFSRTRLPYFSREEIKMLRGSSDFFGVNHYTTYLVSKSRMESEWSVPSLEHDTGVRLEQDPSWFIPGPSWLSFYPPGFRRLLNWISNNYKLRLRKVPIYVTENGMGDNGELKDYNRISYFNEYLYQLLLAKYEDGCNVQGYFAWTLMDDFEWSDGYTSKFGLYHVDFNDPNRKRTPKLSVKSYNRIVRTRTIDFDYLIPRNHHPNSIYS